MFSFLAESKDTGGVYAMVDSSLPASAGAPLHTHTREDEIFMILEGEVEFTSGGIVTLAKAGDHVFQPRGASNRLLKSLLNSVHQAFMQFLYQHQPI